MHGFAAPAEAYAHAGRAGAGTVHVLLPQAIQKIVGVIVPEALYAPSTPASGSFSQKALGELLESSAWADHVLFAGDIGRNAETAILLEKFLAKSSAPVTLTKDAADYSVSIATNILNRPDTLLVVSLAQLQRLSVAAKFEYPVTFSMDLVHLVEWLHAFTERFAARIVVKQHGQVIVAADGQVSTTKWPADPHIWRLTTATYAAVWYMQHPAKPFEALTTAALEVIKQ